MVREGRDSSVGWKSSRCREIGGLRVFVRSMARTCGEEEIKEQVWREMMMKNSVIDGMWQTRGVRFCKKMILKWKQGYENLGQMALGKVGETDIDWVKQNAREFGA